MGHIELRVGAGHGVTPAGRCWFGRGFPRRLLAELEAQPETITRERFVRINFQSGEGMAAHLWPNFADPTGQHLSPAMVRADLDELLRTADIVRRYATNRIAHWLEQDWTEPVTYEDLHTSVDAVGKLLERYSGLLTGATQAADPICRWVETRSSGSRSSNGSAATAGSLRELPELLTSTTGEAQLPSGKRTIEVVLAQPNHDDTDTTASVTVNVTGGGSQTGTCAAPESWSCRILAAG